MRAVLLQSEFKNVQMVLFETVGLDQIKSKLFHHLNLCPRFHIQF